MKAEIGMGVGDTKTEVQIVEYISGFLNGLAEVSGVIRQYNSGAFSVAGLLEQVSAEEAINNYYHPQYQFDFQAIELLTNGSGELEGAVCDLLLYGGKLLVDEGIVERTSYLSFRLMDMLDNFFGGQLSKTKVTKLRSVDDAHSTVATFFHLSFEGKVLVLQFNETH